MCVCACNLEEHSSDLCCPCHRIRVPFDVIEFDAQAEAAACMLLVMVCSETVQRAPVVDHEITSVDHARCSSSLSQRFCCCSTRRMQILNRQLLFSRTIRHENPQPTVTAVQIVQRYPACIVIQRQIAARLAGYRVQRFLTHMRDRARQSCTVHGSQSQRCLGTHNALKLVMMRLTSISAHISFCALRSDQRGRKGLPKAAGVYTRK